MTVPAAACGDFVFVNLFRGPVGAPMRLDAVNDLVAAAARRAGHRPAPAPAPDAACVRLERPGRRRHAGRGPGSARAREHLLHAGLCASGPGPAAGRGGCGAQPARRWREARADRGRRGPAAPAPAPDELPAASACSRRRVPCWMSSQPRWPARIDAAFLAEAGWDPGTWVLTIDPEHPLLGRSVCRAPGCQTTCPASDGRLPGLPAPAGRRPGWPWRTSGCCRRRGGTAGSALGDGTCTVPGCPRPWVTVRPAAVP